MNPDRFQQVAGVFREASRRDAAAREAYLDEACGGDRTLRDAVERLLAADGNVSSSGAKSRETLTSAPPDEPPRPPNVPAVMPARIGGYHLRQILEEGGMGRVYVAAQEHPRRTVALKVMKAAIASRSALRRFEYESQILARLRHPNIAQVYEAGTHEEGEHRVPYFAMEYVPGALPITDYARDKNLGTRKRLKLFAKVCDAVHHGHQKGIIHRDLKPGNVLVDSSGEPKIIDFGVARSTDSDLAITTLQTDIGQLIGTLQYMSPEQCAADPHDLDTRSDVYALGVMLYELLTDRLPYDVSNLAMHEATRKIIETAPQRPSMLDKTLRGDVETIALKALEKDRDRRYQSAAGLAADIQRYLHDEPIVARPASIAYQLSIFARRHRVFVGAIAACLGVLVVASIVSVTFGLAAVAARNEARSERDAAYAARIAAVESARAERLQRERADRRFAQGRDLANVVMEELDSSLAKIEGSLPARALILTAVTRYLDGVREETADDATLLDELADGYLHLARIAGGNQGDFARALALNVRARAIVTLRAAERPDDARLLFRAAAAATSYGKALKRVGRTEERLDAHRESLRFAQAARKRDPEQVKYLRHVSIALLFVGDALNDMGRREEGLEHYRQCEQLRIALEERAYDEPDAARQPRRDLAIIQARLGGAHAYRGEHERALVRYRSTLEIRLALLAEESSAKLRRDVAFTHLLVAQELTSLDRVDEAMRHLDSARRLCAYRLEASPSDLAARFDMSAVEHLTGLAHARDRAWGEAIPHLEASRDRRRAMATDHPDDVRTREYLALVNLDMGDAHSHAGNAETALADTRRAEAIAQDLVTRDPHDLAAATIQAHANRQLGALLLQTGDRAEARVRLTEAHAMYETLLAAQPLSAELREGLDETVATLAGRG